MQGVREKTFALFESMKPGQMIIIRDFARKDPKGFIQMGKDFIDTHYNYEFTTDYKAFRRMYHTIEALEINQPPIEGREEETTKHKSYDNTERN